MIFSLWIIRLLLVERFFEVDFIESLLWFSRIWRAFAYYWRIIFYHRNVRHALIRSKMEDRSNKDEETIHLKVKSQDNEEVFFKIKRTTQLKKLMDKYCERQGVNDDLTIDNESLECEILVRRWAYHRKQHSWDGKKVGNVSLKWLTATKSM